MTARAKIAVAAGGSALVHLCLVGAAVGWIAFSGIPENDHFALRVKLGSAEALEAGGSNYAASREDGEPLHAGEETQSGSVWWSWQAPPGSRYALIEVGLLGGECLAGVYRGFAVDKLDRVAASVDGTLKFSVEPGVDYHIAVTGRGHDAEGPVTLSLRAYSEEDAREPDSQDTLLLLPDIQIEEKAEPKKAPQFVRTSPSEDPVLVPDGASFESDRDTIAASELPPEEGGVENLPTVDGADLPSLELTGLTLTDGEIVNRAPARTEAGPDSEISSESSVTEDAPLAGSGTRAPALAESEVERDPTASANQPTDESATDPAFRPHTLRKKISGAVANQGAAAVDSAETPRGRYFRQVVNAVEKRWHLKRGGKEHGSLKVKATIRPSGKPEGLRIIEQDVGKILTDHAMDSILTAEIPPIPDEVLRGLGGDGYEITFNFYN